MWVIWVRIVWLVSAGREDKQDWLSVLRLKSCVLEEIVRQNIYERDSQEIIQQLIDNSSTFKDKTEYAQDKYIKKKKKKWVISEENLSFPKDRNSYRLNLFSSGLFPGMKTVWWF